MGVLEQLEKALGDRYHVSRELGEGGMATVFLAEDLKHHRQVAVKVLKPELSAVLGGERFLAEIEIAAKLQHPHILPLFDSGQADDLLYYVMPFVEGPSLRERLTSEGQLPIGEALKIASEVGSALQYAHTHGVIHRDIKPENVMLSGGHAVVTDFGIAKALSAAGGKRLTGTGMVIGTPAYMSPEQALGDPVDGRSDLYSLACTLYEMLSGEPPFTGPSVQAVLARHSLEQMPRLRVVRPTVPDQVEDAIKQALAKQPVDRFPSTQRFVDALTRVRSADVDRAGPPPLPPGTTPSSSRRVVTAIGVAAILAVAVITGVLLSGRKQSGGSPAESRTGAVAVLPFTEETANPDSAYVAEGVTEGLIADLAQIGSLKVISRSSGASAAGKSLPEVARELGVDGVVKGSLRRGGDTVRVNVRFHDAAGTAVWSKDYQGGLAELPELQREMTLAIAGQIDAKLGRDEQSRLRSRRDVDQRAYDSYLRGRFHLERGELEPARVMFERAREIAPAWAPPHVGLANYYTSLPFFSDVPPVNVFPKARDALVRALELDDALAEAHAAIAYVRAYYEWDWRAAEQEFRRALELRPNYADAYFSYSRFLAARGRLDEALAQIGRATELDPLSVPLQANTALLNYFAGRYEAALSKLHETLAIDSANTLVKWGIALVAEQQGRPGEAIAILDPISRTNLNRKSSLGHAYAIAGRVAEARSVLDSLHARAAGSYVPAYYFALVHAGLGERDQALQYLERAYQERSTVLAYLRIDPRLRALRDHPRFSALVRSIGGE